MKRKIIDKICYYCKKTTLCHYCNKYGVNGVYLFLENKKYNENKKNNQNIKKLIKNV